MPFGCGLCCGGSWGAAACRLGCTMALSHSMFHHATTANARKPQAAWLCPQPALLNNGDLCMFLAVTS